MRLFHYLDIAALSAALLALGHRHLNAQVSVTPDGNTTPNRTANTGGYSETFTVTNNKGSADEFWIGCGGMPNVTCTGVSQSYVSLGAWGSVLIDAYYDVSNPGTGELNLSAFSEISESSDNGYYNVPVVGLDAPEVDWTPFNADHQDMSRCAAGCFAATHAYTTVPYYTFDTPQSVTLVYHGDRVDPKPFIHVNARYTATPQPTALRLRLKKSDGTFVTFLNGENVLRFQPSTSWVRLGGQFNADSNGMGATGVYNVSIVVGAEWGGGVGEQTLPTTLIVVNENDSPIARGWTVAGIQRLYPQGDGSALITEGNGSAVYFEKSGSTFITPAGEFSTLGTYGSNEWVRRYPDSTKVYFRSDGRMRDTFDRFWNRTRIRYDASNRVEWIDDPYSWTQSLYTSLVFSYGNDGLAWIRDNLGSSSDWRYTYVSVNSSKWLTQITEPDGVSTSIGYDGAGRLQTVTNHRGYAPGFTTTLSYDGESGKLAAVTGPPSLLFEGVVSPVTTFTNWQKVSVPYAGTNGTPFTPVMAANVQGSVTDPGSHTTSFTANRWGQPLVVTDAMARTTTTAYNADGLAFSIQYPSGGSDLIGYDSDGLPYSITAASMTETRIHYAAWALPDSIWGTGQPRQRMWVSAPGRIDSVETGPAGSATKMRYTYDAQGRVLTQTDPAGHQISYAYSVSYGNLSSVTRPGNRVTTYGYDLYGRDTSVTPAGMPTRRVHRDLLNRITAAYDGVYGTPTQIAYDLPYGANEYIAMRVTDLKGQVYDEFRNAVGWVTTRRDPLGHDDIYWYDRDGLAKRWTTRRGYDVDYSYDVLHRLTQKAGSGSETVTFSYSTDGRVVTGASPVTVETQYLNVRGQPDSVKTYVNAWGWYYWRRYAYTSAGLVDSVWGTASASGPDAAFVTRRYAYNTQRGSLETISLAGATTTLSLNSDLLPSTVEFPAGDQELRNFTGLHGAYYIATPASYAETVNRTMTLDSAGRLGRHLREPLGAGHGHGYDGLARLIADSLLERVGYVPCDTSGIETEDVGANCSAGTWQLVGTPTQFQYDSVGNRQPGNYAAGNRLWGYQEFNACSYSFYWDGGMGMRICSGDTLDTDYDAESRLYWVLQDGKVFRFWYDAFGRLARLDTNGVVRSYFLWDGDHLFAEMRGSDGHRAGEYSYYGLDRLHAFMDSAGTPHYAHTDGQGNVIALTNGQSVTSEYAYDAWGNATYAASGVGNRDRARFKGALWMGPELDLYYMRNRWYGPKEGRFWSEDPIGLAGGINPYTFAGNDPVNGRDPLGLCPEGTDPTGWEAIPLPDGTVVWATVCEGGGVEPYELPPVTVVGSYSDPFAGVDAWRAARNAHDGWGDPTSPFLVGLAKGGRQHFPMDDDLVRGLTKASSPEDLQAGLDRVRAALRGGDLAKPRATALRGWVKVVGREWLPNAIKRGGAALGVFLWLFYPEPLGR